MTKRGTHVLMFKLAHLATSAYPLNQGKTLKKLQVYNHPPPHCSFRHAFW